MVLTRHTDYVYYLLPYSEVSNPIPFVTRKIEPPRVGRGGEEERGGRGEKGRRVEGRGEKGAEENSFPALGTELVRISYPSTLEVGCWCPYSNLHLRSRSQFGVY